MWMRAWKTWPISPALTMSRARTTDGFQASGQLIMSRVLFFFAASYIRFAPSAVWAIGFSTIAWSPRFAAASTMATPSDFEEQTRTPSASTRSNRSAGRSKSAVTLNSLRSFSRSGLFGSAPPTIFTPGIFRKSGSMCQTWSWTIPATRRRKGFIGEPFYGSGAGGQRFRAIPRNGLLVADADDGRQGLIVPRLFEDRRLAAGLAGHLVADVPAAHHEDVPARAGDALGARRNLGGRLRPRRRD